MPAQILPLTSQPNQILLATLAINGGTTTIGIRQYWNRIGGFWVMDIYNSNGLPLVSSVPLLTGDWPAANVMAPYEWLNIGAWFIINQGNGEQADWPNSSNLGINFLLLIDDN